MVNQATNIRLFFEVTTLTPFFTFSSNPPSHSSHLSHLSHPSYNRHSLPNPHSPPSLPTIQTPFKLVARIPQKKPPLFENTVGVLVYLKSFLISSFISLSGVFSNLISRISLEVFSWYVGDKFTSSKSLKFNPKIFFILLYNRLLVSKGLITVIRRSGFCDGV